MLTQNSVLMTFPLARPLQSLVTGMDVPSKEPARVTDALFRTAKKTKEPFRHGMEIMKGVRCSLIAAD